MSNVAEFSESLWRSILRTCASCWVGLPDVDVVGVDDPEPGHFVVVVVPREVLPISGRCGTTAWMKAAGRLTWSIFPPLARPVMLRVIRTRWCCPRFRCGIGSWSLEHPEIAPGGHRLTTRAGRWVCEQVGRYARSVSEVADALGCDWHTINDAVVAYGEALVDADDDRIPTVRALSLDETRSWCERSSDSDIGDHRKPTWGRVLDRRWLRLAVTSSVVRVGGGDLEAVVFSESPAGAFDVEHDGVVHESVQDGGCDDGVAEDGAPVGQPAVGGDDGGVALLVAGVHDLEEHR